MLCILDANPEYTTMHHKQENIIFAGKPLAEAENVMIMVHGRGASSDTILGLARHLDVKDFALIAPNATDNAWYPYAFLAPEAQNEPMLSSALELLKSVVEDLFSKGFASKNIYFTGFSQGACLVSEFVGRYAKRYGGVFIFTGGVIGDSVKTERYQGNFDGTPIFIGSGNPDFHVPVERVHATTAIFRALGAEVTERIYDGIPHTVVIEEIREVNGILHLFSP
ncbi:MAG: hypothetical protein RLZZ292_3050 [Bacteroidota bacterium]